MRKFFLTLTIFCVSSGVVCAGEVGHVVISEIQIAGETTTDEWVELFNPTGSPINLTGWRLSKKTATGSNSNLLTTFSEDSIIPAHGFFLIAHADYVGAITADAIYSTTSSLAANNSVVLYSDAGSTVVDTLGFGSTATIFEGTAFSENPLAGQSHARKFDGNNFILDTDDNSADFEISDSPTPQNSNSPIIDPDHDDPLPPENLPPDVPNNLMPLAATNSKTFRAKYSDPETEMGWIEFRIFTVQPTDCSSPENLIEDELSEKVGSNALVEKEFPELSDGEYFWCARAIDNENLDSAFSAIQTFTLDTIDPKFSAESALIATPGDSQVELAWPAAEDDNFAGYFLQTNDGEEESLGSGTTFTKTGLTNGNSYDFVLTARDLAGNETRLQIADIVPSGPIVTKIAEPGELIFNEIAWAGSTTSSTGEWIELRNMTTDKIFDLAGWRILADDGAPEISLAGEIKPGEFFLLERTTDSTVPDIPADQIFTGSTSNDGEILRLFDSTNSEIDRVDGSDAWKIGGDADARRPLARIDANTFRTSFEVDGTPRAANFRDDDLAISVISPSPENPLPGEATIFNVKIDNRGLHSASGELVWKVGESEVAREQISDLASFATLEKTFSQIFAAGEFVISATLEFPADELPENNSSSLNLSVRNHLVINEFAPNPVGADDGREWIELFNPTDSTIPLAGFKINGMPIAGLIEPGGFFTLDNFTGLTNTGGEIILRNSADAIVDSRKYSTAIEGRSFGRNSTDLAIWTEFWHPTKNAQNIETNLPPTAVITIQGSSNFQGECALFVNVTAENSTDLDGDALSFEWDFGNGEISDEENPGGFYFAPGNYAVALTVTDTIGATAEALQNFTVAPCSSGGGTATVATANTVVDEPIFDSVSAERVELKITEVSFDSAVDWIEILVVNDGNDGNGIDLGGFYFESDKRLKIIPQNTKLKTGELLVLEFKSTTPANILHGGGFTKIFSARSGLTATDEQVTLRDSTGRIEDALVWENRSGAWSSGEEADVREIVAGGGWISSEMMDAIDSSDIELETVVARDPDLPDSNSAADWFTTIFATPGRKNSPRPVRASDFHFQISAVAPKNPAGDFVELTCADCAMPVALGGFSLKNSLGEAIFTFPTEALIAVDAPLKIIFNAPEAKLADGIFYATARGLVGSDDFLALQDSENATADFVGWSDRAVPPIRSEFDISLSQSKQLQARFAESQWNSVEAESLLDARGLALGGVFLRQNSADTNSAADFTIQNPNPPLDPLATTTGDMRISEILPNPIGTDADHEWFELVNLGDEPINLFGWIVVVGDDAFEFEENTVLVPGEFRAFRGLLSLRNSASQFTLLDFDGAVTDLLDYPKLAEGVAFAKNLRGEFAETELPTPNCSNVFYQILAPSEDADGDGLTDSAEIERQTDPENFDTDGDRLPDLFEIENGSDPLVADATLAALQKYRAELALIARAKFISLVNENGVFLTGVGVSGGRMRIFIQSELAVIEVPVDENGIWNYKLDRALSAGEHNLFTQLIDQGGFEGVAQKALNFNLAQNFAPPVFAESLRISEVLPNPAGADGDAEFIELQNFGSAVADLSNFTLSVGRKKFIFPANFTLVPGEFRAFTHAETGLTLTNSGGTVTLAWPTQRVIASLTYPKINEGVAFAFVGGQLLATAASTPGAENLLVAPKPKNSRARKSAHKYANGTLSTTIRISEVLANPVGDDAKDEFIELQNFGTTPVNLGNWKISDNKKTFTIPDSVVLRPGEFQILPRSLTKLALNNSGRETVRIANFRDASINAIEFESPAEGIALAFDATEMRETKILTPNARNAFDTQKLTGTIQFRGADGFVIRTEQGEIFVRFGEDSAALLARAIFREGSAYRIFAQAENGTLTLAGFDTAPTFLQTDLLALDFQNAEATSSWPIILLLFTTILFALRFAKMGEIWQPTRSPVSPSSRFRP